MAGSETPVSDPTSLAGGGRADVVTAGAAIVLIAVAAVVGAILTAHGVPVNASAAPLFARWLPHLGPGTPIAIAVAAIVVWRGGAYASSARWGRLLLVGYVTTVAWTIGLALVDGWQRGIAGRLTTPPEYLADVDRVSGIGSMLRGFTDHIAAGPNAWTTHVAGHPPGAFLVFVVLDRIGLGGGGPAGLLCILVGAAAPVCVAVTMRAFGAEEAARTALPYLVLFPAAIWIGTSADGLFTGVVAGGLALLAMPSGSWWGRWRSALGGLLLGCALYLSYGLVLVGALALAVVFLGRTDRVAKLVTAGTAVLIVIVAFSLAGFWWPTGYHLVVGRYYGGYGGTRPYPYWVWANLACLLISAGPVIAPALRRAVIFRPRIPAVVVLPLVAAGVLLIADLTGLSKGETERIWMPYAVWLLAATALLPARHRRSWLVLQAGTALLVNHALLTHW